MLDVRQGSSSSLTLGPNCPPLTDNTGIVQDEAQRLNPCHRFFIQNCTFTQHDSSSSPRLLVFTTFHPRRKGRCWYSQSYRTNVETKKLPPIIPYLPTQTGVAIPTLTITPRPSISKPHRWFSNPT